MSQRNVEYSCVKCGKQKKVQNGGKFIELTNNTYYESLEVWICGKCRSVYE